MTDAQIMPTRYDSGTKRGQLTLDQRAAELIGFEEEAETEQVNLPRPSEAMLYGLAGDVGMAAAATTEANRYAVCMGYWRAFQADIRVRSPHQL